MINYLNVLDLAGMHLMKSEWENAARQYRRAINLADENKSVLKTEDVNVRRFFSQETVKLILFVTATTCSHQHERCSQKALSKTERC